MNHADIAVLVAIILIFGLVMGLMLIVIDEGTFLIWLRKFKCRMGWHNTKLKIGRKSVNKYYCNNCKKPRNHPKLKVIDKNS